MSNRKLCVVCSAPRTAGLGPRDGARLNFRLPGGRPAIMLGGAARGLAVCLAIVPLGPAWALMRTSRAMAWANHTCATPLVPTK